MQRAILLYFEERGCKFSVKSSNSSEPAQYEVVEPDEQQDIEDQMLEFAMLGDESPEQPASASAGFVRA
eukprot:2782885-Karenia_brevis.AAC.1